jgi:hypothetical protein
MTTDPWARYRTLLQTALDEAAGNVEFSHADLVREQQAAGMGESLLAGIVCLRAAEALGEVAESALPGATALVLLAQMGDVFLSLESQDGGASLSTAWGMPRALNAGDAFFAAAQHAILTDDSEISVQRRLHALSILDDATRGYMEALLAAGEQATAAQGEQSLLVAALLLAGVYSGADDEAMARLRRLGATWAGLDATSLAAAVDVDLKSALATAK